MSWKNYYNFFQKARSIFNEPAELVVEEQLKRQPSWGQQQPSSA